MQRSRNIRLLSSWFAVVCIGFAACKEEPKTSDDAGTTGTAANGGTGAGNGGTGGTQSVAGTGGMGGEMAADGGMDDASKMESCTMKGEPLRYCDQDDVVLEDPCGTRTVLGTCPAGTACEEGGCFDFTKDAGRMCVAGKSAPVSSNGTIEGEGSDCDGYCLSGLCVAPGCAPAAGKACSADGDLYEADSCDNPGYLIDDCEGAGCSNGACAGCANENGCGACRDLLIGVTCFNGGVRRITTDCTDETVYNTESKQTPCEFGCMHGVCQKKGTCIPKQGSVCKGKARMTVDSCGEVGEMIEACPDGCKDGVCIDCSKLTTHCEDDKEVAIDACAKPSGEPKACAYGCDTKLGRCTTAGELGDVCECGDTFPDTCTIKSKTNAALGTCEGCWTGGDCFDAGRCTAACGLRLECNNDADLTYTKAGGAAVVIGTCLGCFDAPPTCYSPELCDERQCF